MAIYNLFDSELHLDYSKLLHLKHLLCICFIIFLLLYFITSFSFSLFIIIFITGVAKFEVLYKNLLARTIMPIFIIFKNVHEVMANRVVGAKKFNSDNMAA